MSISHSSSDEVTDVDTPRSLSSGYFTDDAERTSDTRGLVASQTDPPTRELSARVGRYVVVELIGRGGSGMVYVAYDPELDRRVALKLLTPRPKSTSQQRLLREAQALAQLSHPNIVTVYDVGRHNDEVFLAMEFVEGTTLKKWQAAQRSWSDVVAMYLRAGKGLAAAHAAGIVHRDFKPDNVLVGNDGRVCVADFGLAVPERNVDSASGEQASRQSDLSIPDDLAKERSVSALRAQITMAGVLLGTPAYMAPEQHRCESADARSDQFGFCVSLYQGLYRSRPYGSVGSDLYALAEHKQQGIIDPAPAESEVPSWLRDVVVRGLDPDPEKRWPSMAVLLAQLSRDPQARRRRWITGIAVTAILVLVSGFIGRLSMTQAVGQGAICEDAHAALDGAFSDATARSIKARFAATGRDYAAVSADRVVRDLGAYAEDWSAMWRESCEATHVRKRQSDALFDLRASCLEQRRTELSALADIFRTSADPEVLDQAVLAVSRLPPLAPCADKEALLAPVPPPQDPAEHARVEALRADIARAQAHLTAGQYQAGVAIIEPAVRAAHDLGYAPVTAAALLLLSQLQVALANTDDTLPQLEQALFFAAEGHDDRMMVRLWTLYIAVQGWVRMNPKAALSHAQTAQIALRRAGDPPALRASLLRTLSKTHHSASNYDRARDHGEQALSIALQTLAPDSAELAEYLNTVAVAARAQGDYQSALRHGQDAIELLTQAMGATHPRVADYLNTVSNIYFEQGDYPAAQAGYERALAIWEAVHGPQGLTTANGLNNLGNALLYQGKWEQARQMAERALQIRRAAWGPEHSAVAVSLYNIAIMATEQGDYAAASDYYRQARLIWEQVSGEDHVDVGDALSGEAFSLCKQGKTDKGAQLMRRAMDIIEARRGADHPLLVYPLSGVGECELAAGRPVAARRYFEHSLALYDANPDDTDKNDRMLTVFGLARALWVLGERPRALELARDAYHAFEAAGSYRARPFAQTRDWLAERNALPQ